MIIGLHNTHVLYSRLGSIEAMSAAALPRAAARREMANEFSNPRDLRVAAN